MMMLLLLGRPGRGGGGRREEDGGDDVHDAVGVAVEVVHPQLPQPLQRRERAVQVADAVVVEAGGPP
jgi:hypothetical protein